MLRAPLKAADGRTSKAYKSQPQRAKWPCWRCAAQHDADVRDGKKDPQVAHAFDSMAQVDGHMQNYHLGHAAFGGGEKTWNRKKRDARQAAIEASIAPVSTVALADAEAAA